MSDKRILVLRQNLALRNCRFPLRLTLRQSAGGGLACFRQYSDCGGVSCPLWFCFLLRTEMENAKRSLGFLHHYYGSPIPFFQMAAVFFSSLLRYARPFWANFPVTFYNNRNVRSAKNGRKKNATDFQKICGVAAWSIFNFHFHNVRGATALQSVAPLITHQRKQAGLSTAAHLYAVHLDR